MLIIAGVAAPITFVVMGIMSAAQQWCEDDNPRGTCGDGTEIRVMTLVATVIIAALALAGLVHLIRAGTHRDH